MIDFTLPAYMLAPRLLGCKLCFDNGVESICLEINETEAYFGEEDTACHAHKGRTKRTEPMYERGGIAYIYLCYEMYDMLNVVSGPEGHAEAVLIRGAGKYDGPGKLTKALGITKKYNKTSFLSGDLRIEDRDHIPNYSVHHRIGIGYADEKDRNALWRFKIVK